MEVKLRSECKSLLDQLKNSQMMLKDKIHCTNRGTGIIPQSTGNNLNNTCDTESPYFGKDISGFVNVSKDVESDLQPTYARNKLVSLSKFDATNNCSIRDTYQKSLSSGTNIENIKTISGHQIGKGEHPFSAKPKKGTISKDAKVLIQGEVADSEFNESSENCVSSATPSSWQPATPNTIRKRQLIDRHTSVPSSLNAKELKELDNERNLNFSYSHITVDDNIPGLKSFSIDNTETVNGNEDLILDKSNTNSKGFVSSASSSIPKTRHTDEQNNVFKRQLQDQGNDRRHNNFVRETTIKPKSILNSSDYYSLNSSKRNNSKVRFGSSQHYDDVAVPDQRLLGYDWIAALLENDPDLNNQSESFFDDLRDFRKAHKDECCNQFYMQSPYTLVDTEPEPVVEALTEPRVRPYIVNERLFTEPLNPNLIEYENEKKSNESKKEPTQENPRFVRVSIPRSTLQTPYRVRPHRRSSFDGSDSCALMEHCLLGWENTRPSVIPSAQTLDLNSEAGTRIDSETTTLAEAERLAIMHNRVKWPFCKPNARLQTLPKWRKHYMDTTLNLSMPVATSASCSTIRSVGDVKRATDKLLSATYSTMYEMQRLKQERELEMNKDKDI